MPYLPVEYDPTKRLIKYRMNDSVLTVLNNTALNRAATMFWQEPYVDVLVESDPANIVLGMHIPEI